MTSNSQYKFKNYIFKAFSLVFTALTLSVANAAPAVTVDLATSPLVTTATGTGVVLPNIMYVLDNSGSMGLDYMPDYVGNGNKCKSTGTSGDFSASCILGDPPKMSSAFNGIYYNPTITYSPGLTSLGVERKNMTAAVADTNGWKAVPTDAYNVQNRDQLGNNVATTSLVPSLTDASKGYPDLVWCNTNAATQADLSDPLKCKQNSQYIYPNNTGTQATSFNQPYTLRGHPYYYTVAVGEYCTDKNLTSCIASTTPSGAYTHPATLRWCNSNARTSCQAKYIESGNYTYAKWSGISLGTFATGKIKIDADTAGCVTPSAGGLPICQPTSALSINDITVNGVRIIATPIPSLTIDDTTNSTKRNNLAIAIRDAINNYVPSTGDDFTATSSGDEVTILHVGVGPFTGTINVTTSSVTRAAVAGVQAIGSITISRAGKQSGASTPTATRCKTTPTITSCATTITISQVKVGSPSNTNITSGNIVYTAVSAAPDSAATQNALATLIRDNINSTISSPEDYTAKCGSLSTGACTTNVITITAVNTGVATHGTITITETSAVGNFAYSQSALAGGVLGVAGKTYTIPNTITQFSGGTPVVNSFNRVDITPTTLTYPKAVSRTDCGNNTFTTCTYDQEMTNFANWYSYYRTRMQMMKTSTSRAFKSIDSNYRVGFITIANQSSNYVPINVFNPTQKLSWYNQLLSTNPSTSTPLRSALSLVGRIYAGKNPVSGFTADPVQYSCQQNFAILTTDGYWNGGGGTKLDGTTAVGNQDVRPTPVPNPPGPVYEGTTAAPDTLADVAKYYYDTDLRQGTYGVDAICTGSLRANGTKGDVCTDNVFTTPTDNNTSQHMTTFTLGLGVDATLTYDKDYKTATEGDFYDLKQGTLTWPVPVNDSQTAVDDLWHAAVNGQGTYFSAKNPTQLSTSLTEALSSIKVKVGSGAAAATSTLNPVQNDNFAYVASYTSVKWTGNLEKRTVNTTTGLVSKDAVWSLENVAGDSSCDSGTVITVPGDSTNGNTTTSQCVTPGSTAATCPAPGVLVGSDCKVEVASSNAGTMPGRVSDSIATNNPDSRTIYMNNNGVLDTFNYSNLLSTGQNTSFENANLAANLSQYSSLTATQQLLVDANSLVNFLRGNYGFEERSSNVISAVDNRIYRLREAVTGDLADSAPVFVGSPKANFSDPGYGPVGTTGTFKNTQNTRSGTVYVGSNDGMLHAVDATSGQERWAYVPRMVMSNMWKLADKNYSNIHNYYVNGDVVVNDICTLNCTAANATWKTILVAGLNGGGKGYFALDVTNPNVPVLLWEFGTAPDYTGDVSYDDDLGYSFGNPIITKKADGTWVVLLTSGYNNTTGATPANRGKGFLYVLNASTGAKITKFNTGVGDDGVTGTTPLGSSGLAKVNGYVDDAKTNNTVTFVYGGDLLGNIWRFDINSSASATNPFKLALLKDPSGNVQPITVKPELATINNKRVVYVGTGRYLGTTDLTNTPQQQTLYAISDEPVGPLTTLNNPRISPSMVNQVLVNDATTGTRTVQTTNDVDATKRGWYIDLPDSGERQNVASQLIFGTLLVPTTVPTNTLCSPGGYGWLNFLDYKTGKAVSGAIVAVKTNAPIVGLNVLYINGKPVTNIVTADNPTPVPPSVSPTYSTGGSGQFTNHRVIWRELTDEQ